MGQVSHRLVFLEKSMSGIGPCGTPVPMGGILGP
jgi:hypothetical protein